MTRATKSLGALAALLFSLSAHAQFYPLFGPANGVLKGNSASPQTSAATNPDVIQLWSGTCNSTTFLRGDGSCAAPAGTGVSSLTGGTGITLSPSTITSTGSIAITTPVSATNGGSGEAGTITGVLKGNGTSAYTAAASSDISGLWSGTCNSTTFLRGDGSCVATGAGSVTSVALTAPSGFTVSGSPITSSGTLAITTSLSGVLKGTGSAFTTSAAADITGLWSGTCNSGTFLRGDGACAAAGGGSGANPTATVGTTAVNGSASTFLRSDGAPAIDLTMSPVWTGTHYFEGAITLHGVTPSGVSIGVTSNLPDIIMVSASAAANQRVWETYADANTLHSRVMDNAYTTANDWIAVTRSTTTVTGVTFPGGGVVSGTPTGGAEGAGTVNATGYFINGVAFPLTATSASIGGGALIAGACASTATTVTGATTSMAVISTPTTYPGDSSFWKSYVSSSNTVTTLICESIAATPTASTYNIRVIP